MFNAQHVVLLASALSSAFSNPIQQRQASSTLDVWLGIESPIALQGVLNDIGADGSRAPGANSGVVIASPSTENPDCRCLNFVMFLVLILAQIIIRGHETRH